MNQIVMDGGKTRPWFMSSRMLGIGWLWISSAVWSVNGLDQHLIYPEVDYGQGATAELVKRGEYLAKAGNCISCHSDAQRGIPAFAGGAPIETPFGAFYGPNITPDLETGMGRWSEADFVRAMREGIAPDGSNYFPVFPYLYFNRLSDDDLHALWAYFQRIPAVKRPHDAHTVPFPFNIRFAQWGWKLLFFYPYRGQWQPDPEQDTTWNRGAYLVEGLGHCAMCHTPMNVLGASKRSYHLRGNFVEGYWAPDITGEGLERSSIQDIKHIFLNNQLSLGAGPVAGPMVEVNHNSLRYLTDADLEAMAIYLKSIDSEDYFQLDDPPSPTAMARGKEVYYTVCATCHAEGQMGAPLMGDGHNWMWRLSHSSLQAFYDNTKNGYNSMPNKGGCVDCNDEDIKAAVDYMLYWSLSRAQRVRVFGTPKKKSSISVRTGQQIYQQACATCHSNETASAPQLDDRAAWLPYLNQNFDALVRQTMTGAHHPKRGGCPDCRTRDIVTVVQYMLKQSGAESPTTDRTLWKGS